MRRLIRLGLAVAAGITFATAAVTVVVDSHTTAGCVTTVTTLCGPDPGEI
jgi:hypothetical protein